MKTLARLASFAVFLLMFGSGCSPDAALIIVDVNDRPAAVQSLRLTLTLNGKQAILPEQITDNLDNFGLLLPAHSNGSFQLMADGLNGNNCILAQGSTDTVLLGSNRVRLHLDMFMLSSPQCPK